MIERLRVHTTICCYVAIYRPGQTRKGLWVWKKRGTTGKLLTPEQLARDWPTIEHGGIHNAKVMGMTPNDTTVYRSVGYQAQVVFAYRPHRTTRGHWVWRRHHEVAGPFKIQEWLSRTALLEVTERQGLHNVKLTPDEVIQALAGEENDHARMA